MSAAVEVLDVLRPGLAKAGFDLCTAFSVGWYNRTMPAALHLPAPVGSSTLAILIGNTRALWPIFIAAVAEDPHLLDRPHPLDHYVGSAVSRALRAGPTPHDVRFSHEAPPRLVGMQRAAEAAGLAARAPSQLCVHPTYGPWIALRAVVVYALTGPTEQPPTPEPCEGCESGCARALAVALGGGSAGPPSSSEVRREWRRWLAVRDACPIGRSYRYSDPQIGYHYTAERAHIRAEVGRLGIVPSED